MSSDRCVLVLELLAEEALGVQVSVYGYTQRPVYICVYMWLCM